MNDLITPKLNQPRLWIERVEIYGSIAPPELLRGIDFYKGLNVIWGVPNPERKTDDDFGIEFNGHSVGKTSLCRLILKETVSWQVLLGGSLIVTGSLVMLYK